MIKNYTSKFKNERSLRSTEDVFEQLLHDQIDILNPKCMIAFGDIFDVDRHIIQSYQHIPFVQTDGVADYMLALDSQDKNEVQQIKYRIWNDLKQMRGYISDNF